MASGFPFDCLTNPESSFYPINSFLVSGKVYCLQAECEEVKLKRHVYSQAVSQDVAQDLLGRKPRVVQAISAEALSPAIERLGELVTPISEFTIIEGWARKRG